MKSQRIKFISYDGEWPCLCHGQLVLKIGRKTYKFGTSYNDYSSEPHKGIYPKFWVSGGKICRNDQWDMWSEQGKWEPFLDAHTRKELPEEVIDNIDEIMELFNENVPYGCCGGCI